MTSIASPSPRAPVSTGTSWVGRRVTRDVVAIVCTVAIFAAFIATFRFRHSLAEYDLYWVLVGMLDGHATGLGTAAHMHYGLVFDFGYYEAAYRLLPASVLADPDRLIAVVNAVGFASALLGIVALAIALGFAYGSRVAAVGTAIFALAPITLDMSLSGHPMLPALAALFIGAALLFAPTRGWVRLPVWTLATLVLFAGLSIRGEIPIAFAWLAVARADTRSVGRWITSAALRAIPPAAALLLFLVAQKHYADPAAGGSGALLDFLQTFYSLKNIGRGIGFLALGVGPATVLVAGAIGLWLAVHALRGKVSVRRLAETAIGPLALILPCLLFWLPNPSPARHFLFVLLGAGLLIGLVSRQFRWSGLATMAVTLIAILGSQLTSELAKPIVISHLETPYVEFPETNRTLTQVPIGFAWRHHEAIAERRVAWDAIGAQIADSCSRRVIVLADERFELIAALYRGGTAPVLSRTRVGPYDAITATRADGRRVDYIENYHWWPDDAVARLLADPSLGDAAVLLVPYARSIYDHTPVPAERQMAGRCTG